MSNHPANNASELEEIQIKTNTVQNQSLESTRRMLQLAAESEETGIKTLDLLDHQGKQLYRIEEGLDEVNQGMKDVEKNLHGLEKCCGLCVLPWNKTKSFDETTEYNSTWKTFSNAEIKNDEPRKQKYQNAVPTSGYIQKITNDAREDEMDQNLAQVSAMVGNLKNMGIDMGSEIERHNQVVDRLNTKTQIAVNRVEAADERTQQILRR